MSLSKCLEKINDALEKLERKTTSADPNADVIEIKKVNYMTDVQPVLLELRTVIGTWYDNETEGGDE